MDTPNPAPAKKTPTAPQLGDKYNIKPPVLKRPRLSACSCSPAPSAGVFVPKRPENDLFLFLFIVLQLWSVRCSAP